MTQPRSTADAWMSSTLRLIVRLALYVGVIVESKFIMPLLVGDRLSLHPVVIIVVLLIGQEFAGLLGMFFAAPVAALVRVMFRRYWLHRRTTEGIPT